MNGVMEVICPYSRKQKSIDTKAAEDSGFFLKEDDGRNLSVNIYHAYYFQVRAQLKFCSALYADFIVWSENWLFFQHNLPQMSHL